MSTNLKITVGQHSDKGLKEINQDFHGVYVPKEPHLTTKGVAIALADGISSSDVSHIASEATVVGFLEDYFCTPEAWSVKKSAHQVLMATNTWLHSQSQRSHYSYDKDRGYVCTLSAMVIKSTTAHIFHIGDARIYRYHEHALEQLTEDHRMWVSPGKSYLSHAMGVYPQLELDYMNFPVEKGDIFIFATDGVYEYAHPQFIIKAIKQHRFNLDLAAKVVVREALEQGSKDNLTIQIVRIDELPLQDVDQLQQLLTDLPFPPVLEEGQIFDGYKLIRNIHTTHRSHVFLAEDTSNNKKVILKTPSIELRGDMPHLERFMMEEWIAKRINSPNVLKAHVQGWKRKFVYNVTEYIEGQTLTQWMIDHPKPDLQIVRDIVAQIAKGLRAFHRMEMLHQDLRPDNIMIDTDGTVKIIDFGSTMVAGIMEIDSPLERQHLLGTFQYTAPEYLLGEIGTPRSDQFSLGVIAYQMVTGKLPYGAEVAKTKTKAQQNKLKYDSIYYQQREIPAWVDEAIRKAVDPDPLKRYEEISEFVFDLHQPNKAFLNKTRPPLIERDPLLFWKGLSFILTVIIVFLLLRK